MEGMHYSFLRRPIAFHADVFEDTDVSYNLDYADSTGVRHEQTLADVSYKDSDVPNLIAASLSYLPCDTSNFDTDRFIGIVACELPRLGTRSLRETSSIVNILARNLESELGLESQIHVLTDAVIVYDLQTGTMIEFRVNIPSTGRQLNLSVTVPTDHELSDSERYDDVRLAADLWAFLNDFAANLSIEMDCHPSDLGRYVFKKSDPHHTLHVGVPRTRDLCRLGVALLNAQDRFSMLMPEHSTPDLSADLDYILWDNRIKKASDETVNSIAQRAVSLARGGEVSNDIIHIAAEAEVIFGKL